MSRRLEQIALALVEYVREFVPVLLTLSGKASFSYMDFQTRYPDSPMEKVVNSLIVHLELQREKGQLDCPDVGHVVLSLVAMANGIAMYEKIGVHNGAFKEDLVRGLAQVIWRGVAPKSTNEL